MGLNKDNEMKKAVKNSLHLHLKPIFFWHLIRQTTFFSSGPVGLNMYAPCTVDVVTNTAITDRKRRRIVLVILSKNSIHYSKKKKAEGLI